MIQCTFDLRTPAETPGQWVYTNITPRVFDHGIPYSAPPIVGDFLSVDGHYVKVVARQWMQASYGSVTWPHGSPHPESEWLQVMVERTASGFYANEAEPPEDET